MMNSISKLWMKAFKALIFKMIACMKNRIWKLMTTFKLDTAILQIQFTCKHLSHLGKIKSWVTFRTICSKIRESKYSVFFAVNLFWKVKSKMRINSTWMENILWSWYLRINFNLRISCLGPNNLFMICWIKLMSSMNLLNQTWAARGISI